MDMDTSTYIKRYPYSKCIFESLQDVLPKKFFEELDASNSQPIKRKISTVERIKCIYREMSNRSIDRKKSYKNESENKCRCKKCRFHRGIKNRLRKIYQKKFDEMIQKKYYLLLPVTHSDSVPEIYAKHTLQYMTSSYSNKLKVCYDQIGPHFISISRTPSVFLQECCNALHIQYIREARLRWQFRRILYLKRSKAPLANETDPITLIEPDKPIIIYDSTAKKRYVFDALNLSRHISSSLFLSQYGFSSPQVPKNPLTNVPFTYVQLVSIYMQLKKYINISWEIGFYYSLGFDINKYKVFIQPYLDFQASQADIRNLHSEEGPYQLIDFMIECAERNDMIITDELHKLITDSVKYIPDHPILHKFRNLYILESEAEYLNRNIHVHINKVSELLFSEANQKILFRAIIRKMIEENKKNI